VNVEPGGRSTPESTSVFEFGDLLARIGARWRRHVLTAVIAAAVVYGLTFMMPSWYRSNTVILPPEETEQLGSGLAMQRLLSHMPSISGLGNAYTAADVFQAILVSRTVSEAVAQRFGLMGVYHKKSMEKTVNEFRRHARVTLNPDGTISIGVEDRSRQRAADLANAMVYELDRFNVERRNFQAKRSRIFLERRVGDIDSLSKGSEALLRVYQERHHVVAPAEVEASNVGPLADLMAQRINLEVQLSVLRSYLREDNEGVIQTRSRLEQLDRQLATLPGVQNELARLSRDVRLYQEVYVLLSAQLEAARLREVMDTPTVTLLDPAVPTERRARPVRRLWAGAAFALAALASVLWNERTVRDPRPGDRIAASTVR
jgi:uncharacterized protein involved in exopolysaccharide biosynthesis